MKHPFRLWRERHPDDTVSRIETGALVGSVRTLVALCDATREHDASDYVVLADCEAHLRARSEFVGSDAR